MRLSFSAALSAVVAGLLVTAGSAQVSRKSDGDFSVARMTAPPTTGWPTNGGNLYNQRYSPLKAIDRRRSTRASHSQSCTTAWPT